MLSLRRIAVSLLTGGLLLLLLTGLSLRAAAEESGEESFWYIPQVTKQVDSLQEPYFYAPLLSMTHTVIREDGTVSYSGTCCPRVFRMILPLQQPGSGEKPWVSVPAYCTDAATDIRENARYRLENLEEGGSLDEETAGKLRAVLSQSFPRKSVRAIQARANAWLRRQGLPLLRDLQSAEAILAAQAAVWKLTGNGNDTIRSLYSGTMELTEEDFQLLLSRTTVDEPSTQVETDSTASNVESLFSYLCNLPPEEPGNALVSVRTFREAVYSARRETEGTFTVSVRVSLDMESDFRDCLTIRASCEDQCLSRRITGGGEYDFTFQGLSRETAVTVEILGKQYANDVYLFAAEQGDSQPLAGFYTGMVPVQTGVVLTGGEAG